MNRFAFIVNILAAISLLSACQGTPQATSQSAPPTVEVIQPSPTPVVKTSPQPQPATPTPAPESTREPSVRFTFPTPGAVPASLWRPPLYPIPWALSPYDHFYFTRPIAVNEINWPESDYRYGGLAEGKKLAHSGVDIAAPRNTPVLVSAPGRVVWVGFGLSTGQFDPDDPYGLAVAIDHEFGFGGYRLSTVYAHLDRIDIPLGKQVQTGEQLGVVGTTGNTTGPHLHYEVRLKIGDYYSSRNPELWLAPPQGWGVLVGRLMRDDGSPLIRQLVYIKNTATGQIWPLHTYGPNNTHSDDYYLENLVISDLPAGPYEVSFEYRDKKQKITLTVNPGAISYFTFRDERGFNTALPATPSPAEWLVITGR